MKRFIAFLTAASLALSTVTAIAEEGASSQETNNVPEASAVFVSNVQTKNMSVKVGSDSHYAYTTVEKEGKKGWLIKPERSINPAIYVDLNKSFAYNISDNSSYEVEVEYFDEGEGQFRIKYDAVTDPWKDLSDKSKYKIDKTEIVKLEDSGQWKTHTFILDHPLFRNNLENSDFCITLHEEAMGISLADVVFGSVKVRKLDTKSDVRVHMSTTEIGNNFFEGDTVKINLDLYNTSKENKNVSVKLCSYDFCEDEIYNDTFDVSVDAKSSTSKAIEINQTKYSICRLTAEITGDGIYSSAFVDYAYSAKAEKQNPHFGVNNHMYRLMQRDPDKLIPLMANAGFSMNREGIWWDKYELQKGVYAMPTRADKTMQKFLDYNMDQMLILMGNNPTVYGGNGVAVGEQREAAFLNYVRAQATELKGKVTCWELFNETNLSTVDGIDAHWYARMLRGTYEILKEIDPENRVVMGATAGTPLEWLKTIAIEAEGCFDVVTIHPYCFMYDPIEADRYGAIIGVRNVLDECGATDVPIWLGEMGWSSAHVGYERQAAYNMQMYVISQAPELKCDKFLIYDFQDDGYMPEDQENNFGLIKTWDTVDTPWLAKPFYLAAAFLNSIFADAEYVDKTQNDNINMFRFKLADGREASFVWTRKDNYYTTFDVNGRNTEFYDMYGNRLDIYGSDGKYSLMLDYKPIYIVGDYTQLSADADEDIIGLSRTKFDMPYNDTNELVITKNIPDDAKVNVVMPENGSIQLLENNGFDGNKATIKFKALGAQGKNDNMRVIVKGNDDTVFLDTNIIVNFTDVLTVSFGTNLYGDGNLNRWIGTLTVKNNNHTNSIKGKAVFNAPSDMSEKIKYIDIPEIQPGEQKSIKFNMPEVEYGTSYFVDADIVLEDGFTQSVSLYADCCVAVYADTKPVIDAVASPGEWDTSMHLWLGDGNEYELMEGSYDGNDDLSAAVDFKWDEENIYMFASVTDDIFYQNQTGSTIWQGDSIQLGLSYGGVLDPNSTSFTELAFALTQNGTTIQRYSNEAGASGSTQKAQLAVRREGTVTYYELSMPWSEIIKDGTELHAGDSIRFNMIINDNDKRGRWGWVEYADGIGVYKNGSLFGYLRLIEGK